MNIWDNLTVLDALERQRDELRRRGGRLTFDCMNLASGKDRARCLKGHILGQARDGSLALISVLRGISSGTCKGCGDYNTEEEN